VSLIDVMPTILDLVGVEVPSGLDGRSLLGLGGGIRSRRRSRCCAR
jgi:arylsulfatase A-like enzyme